MAAGCVQRVGRVAFAGGEFGEARNGIADGAAPADGGQCVRQRRRSGTTGRHQDTADAALGDRIVSGVDTERLGEGIVGSAGFLESVEEVTVALGCQSGNVLDEDDFGAQYRNEAGGVNEQVGAPVAEPVAIFGC